MFRRLFFSLVAGLVVLPIVLSVLVALARLLGAMGDAAGGCRCLTASVWGWGSSGWSISCLLVLVLALERVGRRAGTPNPGNLGKRCLALPGTIG